jgi:hypothetical protein
MCGPWIEVVVGNGRELDVAEGGPSPDDAKRYVANRGGRLARKRC